MDAENAAAPVDLENGGGAVTVEMWPHQADRRLKEKQPFTWLRAVPYITVMLVGAVLFAVGLLLASSGRNAKQGQDHPYHVSTRDDVAVALCASGMALASLGLVVAFIASEAGCCERNLRRFGPD